MAKVEIIAKLKQKNDADFKIADAKDIEMEDGSDLQSTIDNIKKNGTNIDTEKYATKEELETKANKTDLHEHSNKNVIDKIEQTDIDNWNSKANKEHTHDYNDITNAPTIPSIDGLATEEYVNTAIANAQLGGGEIDTSNFATKEDLNTKVDKKLGYSLVSDDEISRLSSIDNYDDTQIKNELNDKSDIGHTHSYNDLTDKPTIPSIEGLATESYVKNEIANAQLSSGEVDLSGYATKEELSGKADKTHTHTIADVDNLQTTLNNKANTSDLHSHSNKSILDGITSTNINNWNNKSEFSGSYNDLTDKPTIPSLDGYATETFVTNKIAEAQLSGGDIDLSGYATKDELNSKANKTDLHSHNNKTVIDTITQDKITTWDNKSDFSGDYNDLTNKPTIPTKTSQLTNDSNFTTQAYVDNAVAKVDLSAYATKEDLNDKANKVHTHTIAEIDNLQTNLNNKANKTDLHSHSNKTVLDSITSTDVENWNNKSEFSGDYNDLTNKPTIPSLEGYATQNYVKNEIANAQLGSGQEVDLSGYATKDELNTKVDKIEGYSLVSDSEITRLSKVDNYDDTEIKNSLNSKANKTDLHSHANKNVLDGISSIDVENWNNKSEFSGDYNDLTNKPTLHSHSNKTILDNITASKVNSWDSKSNFSGSYNDLTDTPDIPTKTSDLINDSNFVNSSDLNKKADKTELHSHINKTILDNISSDDINNWNSKTSFDGNYNSLTNKPTIPTKTSDLTNDSNFVNTTQLNTKVDKKTGYSLVADTEIKRLANVDNYDDTEIKNELNNKSDIGHTHSYNDLTDKPSIPSIEGLATETFVTNKIAEAQLSQGEIDLTGYATKDDLKTKADKSELHSHSNKTVLDGITSDKVTSWDNKSNFSGNYNDLTNKPTLHSHSNKNTLDTITDEKIAEWDSKSTFSGSYNDLTNKPTIPTKTSQLTNDSGYVTSTSLHSHTNKAVLDGITTNKINEWNNKSTFSGDYNDLTNKPTIPTKTSQLTNDSNFATTNQLHNHSNKTVLDGITLDKIESWDNKSTFSGSYNDLTNKPTIPVVDSSLSTTSTNAIQNKAVANALNNKANSSHNHTIANITNLQTSLNGKSDVGHTHSYNDLSDKPTIPTVDVTKSYVDAGLNKKVDKKIGYSLVADSEIKRLSNVDNYDDTAIKASINSKANSSDVYTKTQTDNLLSTKANKTDLHSHSNKTVLDSITEEKLTEWDNKSSFSGNYNDLTNKPTIPKVDSVLSSTSTNAIQNKVVKSALDGKANSSHTHNISDVTNLQNSLDSKSDNTHTHSYNDLSDKPTIPTMPTIDSALSTTSTNPVQNKIITNALNNKSDKGHTHNYSDITNTPTIPTVDSALSTTSTNAIQNKVVTNALNNKANSSHTHNYAGSSSSGGSASSAIKLATSRKISLNGDASGSANFDGTSDITINTSVRKYCMVGSDVENSNGWYKVASETMSGYGDTNITFAVTSTYGNYHSGILQLQIRSDNTSISCKTLIWLNRYGFSTDNFVVNINNMTWTLYANQTMSRYGRLMFEVISESSITSKTTGITLFNSNTKESTTPVATVKSKDGGKVDNASTANKLATSRTLTIGKTGKTFDGSANVSWSLDEIGASASSHTHTISNVTNLQSTLNNKSDKGHTHDYSELNNPPTIPTVDSALSTTSTNAIQNKVVKSALDNKSDKGHKHAISEITNLQTALDGKSNTGHTHDYSELNNPPTIPVVDSALSSTSTNAIQNKVVTNALNNKANSSHTHSYKDLSDKPTIPVVDSALSSTSTNAIQNKVVKSALDGKSNTNHTHSYKELSDKPTIPVVDSALSSTSTNPVQNKVVTNALNGKANSSHTHSISNITNLQTTLDGKSNINHTHNYAGSSSAGGDATNALACSGNATTSTKLQTARTINGTSFDGSANITTNKWGTARNITIGNTTKTIDGSGNISWTLREIGADGGVITVSTVTQLKSALMQGGIIHVEAGEYVLGANEELEYISNTHLIGIGEVTIKVNPSSSSYIALKPHLDGTETGYDGVYNTTIENIIFDGQNGTNAYGLFATAHCKNITLKKCTFLNLKNSWHMVEINSSYNTLLEDCTFEGYNVDVSDDINHTEAVQLDFAGGNSNYPFTCNFDGTGVEKVIFKRCTFKHITTSATGAIGSHSLSSTSMPRDILVEDCTFKDVDICIYAPDYYNFKANKNEIYNCGIFMVYYTTSDQSPGGVTLRDNHYNGLSRVKKGEGRFFDHRGYTNQLKDIVIENNIILNAGTHGIGVTPLVGSIERNLVRNCAKNGIYLYGYSFVSCQGNICSNNAIDIYGSNGQIGKQTYSKLCNNIAYVRTDGSQSNTVAISNNL